MAEDFAFFVSNDLKIIFKNVQSTRKNAAVMLFFLASNRILGGH